MKNCRSSITKTIHTFGEEKILPIVKSIVKVFIFCGKIALRIIGLIDFAIVVSVPFLQNHIDHTIAQWLWYSACFVFIILIIIDRCVRKKPVFKTPIFEFWCKAGEYLLVPFMSSFFVFHYYDIDKIWLWVIFAMIAIAIPIFFFAAFLFRDSQNQRSEKETERDISNLVKNILLYWLYDLFYMSIFNNWIVLTYVFGLVSIVVIFANLTKAFLGGNKTLQMFLPFDLLVGIGLIAYLIYIVPDESLQNIILAITTSVLGGLLALLGVAWTIRHTNKLRQEDLRRIEAERKEEERKKHTPYIRISYDKQDPSIIVNAHITKGLNLQSSEDAAQLTGKVFYSVNVRDFNIKNVSNANIIVKGVQFHGKYYEFSQVEILEPGVCCQVKTTNNWHVPMPKIEKSISLIVSDILGNSYEIVCPVNYNFTDGGIRFVETIGEEKYTGFDYPYVVVSAELPILLNEDTVVNK